VVLFCGLAFTVASRGFDEPETQGAKT